MFSENMDVQQMEDDILWLKSNKEPWSKVLDLWKSTSRLRIKHFKEENVKVHDYMDMYPGLKDKSGYYLVSLVNKIKLYLHFILFC